MSDVAVQLAKDDSGFFGAVFSRLANTNGSMLIETPPRGHPRIRDRDDRSRRIEAIRSPTGHAAIGRDTRDHERATVRRIDESTGAPRRVPVGYCVERPCRSSCCGSPSGSGSHRRRDGCHHQRGCTGHDFRTILHREIADAKVSVPALR